MAENKRDVIRFITPRGIAIYPKLHKADTKFKPQGEYSVKLRLAADATPFYIGKEEVGIDDLKTRLGELLDRFFDAQKEKLKASKEGKNKAKAKTLKKRPIEEVFAPHLDDDGEETGDYVIKGHMIASGKKKDGTKWERSPTVFDAKRKPLKPVPAIFGGSVLKVGLEAVGYYAPNDNIVGVTFYIDGVQVLKLVKGGERDAASMGFGEEEGYSGDENEDASGFPPDDEDDDSDGDDSGDADGDDDF